MVDFDITILGCGSAKPTLRHYTSSQVVKRSGTLYMIDCGEGAQRQFQRYGFHEGQLENIFISHAHGDHCLGLIGFLSSLSLNGRNRNMNLYLPAELVPILQAQIDFFIPHAAFGILLHPIDSQKPIRILSDEHFDITALPLQHRIPCYGFLFEEKPGNRHIIADCIKQYNIPRSQIKHIQQGGDFTTADGQVIPNACLTTPPTPTRSYAYLSDTRPIMEYAELLHGVDLLYHDSTYAGADQKLAVQYDHSTSLEAAMFAEKCQAGQLLLGHYSSRYHNDLYILEDAIRLFPHTMLTDEGMIVPILDKTAQGPLISSWKR